MSYSKYYVYKEQISTDGGASWQYTGNETPSGESIGTYSTLEECEGSGPTPGDFKWKVYHSNFIRTQECDGTNTIVEGEIDVAWCSPKKVEIGNCVTTIGDRAFYDCKYESCITAITIPNTVRYIGEEAFACNDALVDLILPNSITNIESYAFADCDKITNINIPTGITEIKRGICMDCTSITSVTIPNSVRSIGKIAFRSCAFPSISIPNSVLTIDEGAFYNCTRLTSITMPNSVTTINRSAFYNCTSLTNAVIPDSVTTFGDDCFGVCTSLTSVTIGTGITELNGTFLSCTSLTSVTIPSSVTTLYFTFYDSGIKNIVVPGTVNTIGTSTFYNCTGLTSCTIGNGVTTIGEAAFQSCSNLTTLTFPSSITNIEYAFGYCDRLRTIRVEATTPPTIPGNNLFGSQITAIYVPSASVSIYKSTPGWSYYSSRIQAIP